MTDIQFTITFIKRLTSSGLVTFTSARISDMGSCAAFLPSPTPTIAGMTTLRDNYQGKEADYKKIPSEANKQHRDDAYDALINGHLSWIAYADPLIGDNAEYAALFGYPQYAERTPAVVPEGVPTKPRVVLTANPGEIILMAVPYKQDKKLIFYNWQISTDGGQTYTYLPTIGHSHRRKITLTLGQTYLVRLAYATTAGEGPFSDPLEISLTRDMVKKVKKLAA